MNNVLGNIFMGIANSLPSLPKFRVPRELKNMTLNGREKCLEAARKKREQRKMRNLGR